MKRLFLTQGGGKRPPRHKAIESWEYHFVTWARLDDSFYDHPKIRRAGPLATLLWLKGIAYCARHLTDGYLDFDTVEHLGTFKDYPLTGLELAETLVRVGLFEDWDGGYRVHDYLDYNPSKEQVMVGRKEKKDAQTKGGKARAASAIRSGDGRFTGAAVDYTLHRPRSARYPGSEETS